MRVSTGPRCQPGLLNADNHIRTSVALLCKVSRFAESLSMTSPLHLCVQCGQPLFGLFYELDGGLFAHGQRLGKLKHTWPRSAISHARFKQTTGTILHTDNNLYWKRAGSISAYSCGSIWATEPSCCTVSDPARPFE